MRVVTKYLGLFAAGVTLAASVAAIAPSHAMAQFDRCWGCVYTSGMYSCVRGTNIQGAYHADDCQASVGECALYDTSCGPQTFGADGSALNERTMARGETPDEPVVVVASAAVGSDNSTVAQRSTCSGAIIARNVNAMAGAKARAATRSFVL